MDRLTDYFTPYGGLGDPEQRHRIAAALANPQLVRNAIREAVAHQDLDWLNAHLAVRESASVPYASWLLAGVYERATGRWPTQPAARIYATLHIAVAVLMVESGQQIPAARLGRHVAGALAAWQSAGRGLTPIDPSTAEEVAGLAGECGTPLALAEAIAARLGAPGIDAAAVAPFAIADLVCELAGEEPTAAAESPEIRCMIPVVGPDHRSAEIVIHAEARPWRCRALYQHPHFATDTDDEFEGSVSHAWAATQARCGPQAPPVALRWWLTTADDATPVPSISDGSAGVGMTLALCRALEVDWRPRTRRARERASRRLVTGRIDSAGDVQSLETDPDAGSAYSDKRHLIKNRQLVVPDADLDRVRGLLKGARGFQRVYGAATVREFDHITKRGWCRPLVCLPAALVLVVGAVAGLAVSGAGGGAAGCDPVRAPASSGAVAAQIQVPREGVSQADCVRGTIHELAAETVGHVVVRGDDDFPRYFAQGRPLREGSFAVCSAFGRSAEDAPGDGEGALGADVGKVFRVLVVQADEEATRLLRVALLDNRGLLDLPTGATVLALVEVQRTADGARCTVNV